MQYYILTQKIVDKYQGFQKENFAINFTQTNTGKWVINVGCGEEIFNEIDWTKLKKINLEIEDFQPTHDDKILVGIHRIVSATDLLNGKVEVTLYNTQTKEYPIIEMSYIDTWEDSDLINLVQTTYP